MAREIFDTTSRWVNIYQLNEVINDIYETIENSGGSSTPSSKISWGEPVQNVSDLPKNKNIGYVALVLSEMKLYVYNGTKYIPLSTDVQVASSEDILNMFK